MTRQILCLLLIMTAAGRAQDKAIYSDAAQRTEKRIDDLLPRLTLEEKISLLHADTKFTVAGVARLGIPPLHLSDGPHGVREEINPNDWRAAGRTDDYGTWMPSLEGLAATWNPSLAEAYGKVLGQEAAKRGKNIILSPGMNIQRTPLGGRNFEFFGEDPFLAARMAVGDVRGIQSQGVASCIKHFAANNQEQDRDSVDVEVDERTLHEIYLPAFKAAVQEGGALAVMGAYNKLNGQYCCQNEILLNTILKGDWGFTGLVMTDWGAAHDTVQCALHGLDLEMGTNKPFDQYYFAKPLLAAVQHGDVPMAQIDDKVRRHLRLMVALHMLDAGYVPPAGAANTADHQAAARHIAEEGIVLLKNDDDLLPLNPAKLTSLAVIGENAVRKFAHAGGSAEIKALYEITPLQGILDRVGNRVNVSFSMGYAQPPARRGGASAPSAADMIARAVAAAKSSDAVIIVGGLNHESHFDSEGSDRRDISLPYGQDDLIRAVTAANPHTAVVLVSGGVVDMNSWLGQTPAVIQAFYPGMEGGHALAGVLFGDINPSGKLPCTFPRQLADSPAHALHAYPGENKIEPYTEGLLVGYRWFDAKNIAPLFPFGYGLSYTRFEYSNLKVDAASVQCDIANVGPRDGEEVVQVYVKQQNPTVPRPPKELKGFAKVMIRTGEKQTVTIPLDPAAFSHYDADKHAWVADKDRYTILVGASSADIRLHGDIDLK
jgi:beta-glucosidase